MTSYILVIKKRTNNKGLLANTSFVNWSEDVDYTVPSLQWLHHPPFQVTFLGTTHWISHRTHETMRTKPFFDPSSFTALIKGLPKDLIGCREPRDFSNSQWWPLAWFSKSVVKWPEKRSSSLKPSKTHKMTLSFEIYFLFLSDPVDRIEFNHKKLRTICFGYFISKWSVSLHQLRLIIKIIS